MNEITKTENKNTNLQVSKEQHRSKCFNGNI